MAIDAKSFIDKHKDHLTPEEIAEIEDTSAGYMRNDDYHKKMDAGKRANEDFRLKLVATESQFNETLSAAEALEQRLGVPLTQLVQTTDPNVLRSPATGEKFTTAQVQKLVADAVKESEDRILAKVGPAVAGTFSLAQRMPGYYAEYQQKFSKMFPADKYVAFCNENQISDPDLGYKLFTADDDRELLKKQHAADLVKAGEDAVRAFRTTHHIPETSASRPPMHSPLMRIPTVALPPPPAQTTQPPPPVAPPPPPPPGGMMTFEKQAEMQRNFDEALAK